MSFVLRCAAALAVLVPLLGAAARGVSGTDEGALVAAVEEALAARYPSEAARLDVRVLRTSDGLPAPLRVALPARTSIPSGHTRVDVLGRSDGGWQKTGWALLYVAHFDSVVVARRTVSRGDAVDRADLGTAWMETTTFHGAPLRAADLDRLAADRGSLFAERRLREGRALRQGDLRLPFAADTGDAVTLRFRRSSIVLELACRAREPGHVGDEIRLYSPDTDATYHGRLTAPGEAEWTATL